MQPGSSAIERTLQRRIWRTILLAIPVLTLIGVAVLVVRSVVFSRQELDCVAALQTAPSSTALLVCQREYQRTHQPTDGVHLADALRRSGDLAAAGALANDLLGTEARADALQVLGKIAVAQHRSDEAVTLFQQARRLHRDGGNRVGLALDDLALAEIQTAREQYTDSLQNLDECIGEARVSADERTEGYCHLTAARALMYAGHFEAAAQELDRAMQQLSSDHDLAEVWYWRGNLKQELVRDPSHRTRSEQQAVATFERGLELARRAQVTSRLPNLHMNLAFSLAELGRTQEADRHLAEAGLLDRDGEYTKDRAQLAARIAYRRGDLALASSLNDRLYPTIDDRDDQIDVCVMQARIALATNGLAAAALWAKRGIDVAEAIRAKQTLAELRPWVLASRREPFEVLFTALARAGRIADAVVVFDQWQGRTLLDEMARPSPDPSLGLLGAATRIQSLGRWLPAVAKAPLMTSDGRAVMQALAKIDLIALAVAEGDVWRLTARHGRLALDNLGPFEKLRDLRDSFISEPTDPALASELGALILPDDMVRKTEERLYVVLDSPLAALPFVALRRNDQPVIAARPVLREPRFPVIGACRPRTDVNRAVVLADADGSLPDARRESSRVASLFGTTPFVGDAATSTALFAARSDPLLHVAVHAGVDAGGGNLKLYDRAVSAPEISANKLGPSLVVLSACSTASSWDPELAGSLATAFLAGGSQHVVATLRAVSDTGALELTSRFYDARGAEDPVGALAKIQAALSRSEDKDWPNFAVFGNEICDSSS